MKNIIGKEYIQFLNEIKSCIVSARIKAYRSVNKEHIKLYWDIGRSIIERQEQQHHAFEAKIREFYEELHANPLVAQFDVLSYLRDWLVKHIQIEDAKLQALVDG